MNNKILIVAGTHQREKEFSFPVADRLISLYGANTQAPHKQFYGIDGARRGDYWDLGPIAVGKVVAVGSVSRNYLEGLSDDRLKYLAGFRVKNRTTGTDAAETFEHESQYTSVLDDFVRESNPLFFIDVHSYHASSRGLSGTAGDLTAHVGNKSLFSIMNSALEQAQSASPDIYGRVRSSNGFNPSFADPNRMGATKRGPTKSEFYIRSIEEFNLSRDELLDMLSIDFNDASVNADVQRWQERIPQLKESYTADRKLDEEAVEWGNRWMLRNCGKNQKDYDSFTFEGVHWGKENQDAFVNFVSNYLVPNLR